MVEWFKAPVLKTGVSLYGTMGSNPFLLGNILLNAYYNLSKCYVSS